MYLHAWSLYLVIVTSLQILSHACNVILNSLQQCKDPVAWQVCFPHHEKQVLNYQLCHLLTVL